MLKNSWPRWSSIKTVLCMSALVVSYTQILAQPAQNIALKKQVVAMAGGAGASDGFNITDALGQPSAVGISVGSSFQISAGFFATAAQIEAIPIAPITTDSLWYACDEYLVEIHAGTAENPVPNLFGVSFTFNYSHANLEIADVLAGNFLGSDIVFFPTIDSLNSKIYIGITRKSGAGGVNGHGIIAQIALKVRCNTPDHTTLDFALSDVVANDSNGAAIHLAPQPLNVTVRAGMVVWAGDTNNDGTVNQIDILPLGLYWNYTGPASAPVPTSTWAARISQPWTPRAATYADANGDGIVNQADVLCIGLNWGKTHSMISQLVADSSSSNPILKKPNSANMSWNVVGGANPGEEFWVEVAVENVTNLFGVSFELTYVPATIAEALEANAGSFLGTSPIFFANIDTTTGTVSIGISKKAGEPGMTGSGVLAKLKMKMFDQAIVGQDTLDLTVQNIVANDPEGNAIQIDGTSKQIITAVVTQHELPTAFFLYPNKPNPFNPETVIAYDLPSTQKVTVAIYDILGRRVRVLVNTTQQAGRHEVIWDGRNENGNPLSSGTYFYQLRAGDYVKTRKMLYLR